MTAVFQELMSVESNDTGLVGLGYIREDNVHHADQHSVFVGMSGVLDDGYDVHPLLSDVDKSLPDLCEISTAYTIPSGPTMSAT